MKNTNSVILTNNFFIAQGNHKKCYIHPTDSNLCIKILFKSPDIDLEKELSYRKVLKSRGLNPQLLPKYYGSVPTNMGVGYIFERCCDYDGKTSLTIKDFINLHPPTDEHLDNIIKVILKFKNLYFSEKVVTSDMDPENFVIQRLSETDYTIKIIDNIGTPVMIPLAYYFDFFATKRAKKYWKKFLNYLQFLYPEIFTQKILNKIK